VVTLLVHAKCGRKNLLKLFPFAQVHMHTAWQTRIKAAHCAHDVNALEAVRAILFEDRRVLHGILVGARRTIDVAHTAIPGCRWIGMVVGDLAVLDDHVMGKHTAHRLMEPAADGLLGYREIAPGLGVTGAYLVKRLLHTVQRNSSSVGLEVCARTVTLNSVTPLRDLPLELYRW